MILLNRSPLVKYKGVVAGWDNVWLKDETRQVSGAFKIRGVLNYFISNRQKDPVVTASTGNHGSAVAIVASDFGLPAFVFIPSHIAEKKKVRLRQAGAHLVEHDGSYDECEVLARQFAEANGYTFVHSFDDNVIIEGHKSIFDEIEEDHSGISSIFIPVGGGGLLTAALRYYHGDRSIFGVEFSEAPALYESLQKKERLFINIAPNPVEGLCVSQIGEKVFEAAMQHNTVVDIVDIDRIREAMRLVWQHNGIKCEMAGAASLAAALSKQGTGGDCVCVLSGGNIDDDLFNSIIGSG